MATTLAFAAPSAKTHETNQHAAKRHVVVNGQKSHNLSKEQLSKRDLALKTSPLNGKANKVSLRSAAPITSEVVEGMPEGTSSWWIRSSQALQEFWGEPYDYEDKGFAIEMVETADGKVWMKNPFSQYPVPGVYYAVKGDNTLTIPGGQCVYEGFDWDEEVDMKYYLIAMTTGEDGDFYAADNLDYTLVNENGTWKSQNPELYLGLASWDEATESYIWRGQMEYDIVYVPQNHKTLEAPASLETERWAYVNSETGVGYYVNVGTDNNALYIQGLYQGIPEAWLKLEINGDKATFKGQYLGHDIDTYHYVYLMPGRIESEWDEDWEEYVDMLYAEPEMSFEYDAENKVLATDGAIIISTVGDAVFTIDDESYFYQPRINKQNRVAGTLPTNPIEVGIDAYDEYWGEGLFYFAIPCMDTDGNMLESKNLYYNIFVDGELFTFYNDEYSSVPEDEPMVNVPWGYKDYDSFDAIGIYQSVLYYFTGFETMGVQSVYFEENESGNTTPLKSEIISVSTSGIASVAAESKTVKCMEYIDLNGRIVTNPEKGIYIRRTTYSDGTISNQKVVK